jgi:glycosyltransferase A (GT-A) superfamily protein (DUF2064 family)
VAALGAPSDPGLDAALGRDGAARLREAMWARARRWAAAVAGGGRYEATSLDAAIAAVHDHDGPVLLAAPDVPALDEAVAAVALEDLAAGCQVVIGLGHDARPYLVGLPRPDPALLEVATADFTRGMLPAFAESGLLVGMLAPHRRLASAADVRALAIDPLTPRDLLAVVRA